MNTVNKETAFALKEAGFPQPEPAFGQVWYDTNEMPMVIVFVSYKGIFTFTAYYDNGKVQPYVLLREALAEMAFAPNAVDILAEMPASARLSRSIESEWVVKRTITQFYDEESFVANPHTAAAHSYLAMQAEAK